MTLSMRLRLGVIPASISGCILTALLLLLTPCATADEITLRGTHIPLPPVQVQRIDSGRVAYLDHRGRMARTNVQEIRWIFFDDLPELQQAEEALEAGDLERGLMLMLKANLAANETKHRLWTHYRLVQLHDDRGEMIEAAGHLASIVGLDDDPAWTRFESFEEPLSTSIHAIVEARDRVQRARASVRDASVHEMLDRMLERIEQEYDTPREDDPETRPDPDATISGYLIETLRDGELRRPDDRLGNVEGEQETGDMGQEPVQADDVPGIEADKNDDRSNHRLAQLIERKQWREALELCEQIADDADGRDLAEFLYHYGTVLREKDRPRDAAMMFMRSAIHYPDAHIAPLCLIEAAEIIVHEFGNHRAARRMLDQTEALLTDEHDPGVQQRLRELNESLSHDVQPQ